jgi:signal peptidase II
MREGAPGTWWRWLIVSAAVVALDLATKSWMSSAFRPGEVQTVLPFFNLVLVHNAGAAFSFLAGESGWQRWAFSFVALAISAFIVVMLRRGAQDRLLALGLALILGGALGNLYDRVSIGSVIDFIQLHALGWYFPAFNVADSSITIGVGLLIWDSLFGHQARNANGQALPAAPEENP